jgi:hypothetical protein
MPYMDMADLTRKKIGAFLFGLNVVLCLTELGVHSLDNLVNLLGSTTMPFITFAIPGVLYYKHLKLEEGVSRWKLAGAAGFAGLGFLFNAYFMTMSIHNMLVFK